MELVGIGTLSKRKKNFFCTNARDEIVNVAGKAIFYAYHASYFCVSPQAKLKKAENFSLKTPGSFVKDVSNFNECCGIYGVGGNCDGKSMASWGEVVVSRVKGVK